MHRSECESSSEKDFMAYLRLVLILFIVARVHLFNIVWHSIEASNLPVDSYFYCVLASWMAQLKTFHKCFYSHNITFHEIIPYNKRIHKNLHWIALVDIGFVSVWVFPNFTFLSMVQSQQTCETNPWIPFKHTWVDHCLLSPSPLHTYIPRQLSVFQCVDVDVLHCNTLQHTYKKHTYTFSESEWTWCEIGL